MRELNGDDIFLLSEIADKMDFEMPKLPNIKKGIPKEVEAEIFKQFGLDVTIKLFKKGHKAKKEINELIESLTGKNPKNMNFKEMKEALTEIMNKEGVLDAFK